MQFLFNHLAAQKRHERLLNSLSGQCLKRDLLRTVSALGVLCAAHTAAMMGFEGLSLGDSLWLTTTTVATVGYGDLSAHTLAGRIATFGLMYVGGIALLAQGAAKVFEYRQEKRDRILNGKWSWKMNDHIVFLNAPDKTPAKYLFNLMKEFRNSALPKAQAPVLVVTPNLENGMTDELRALNVAHVNYDPLETKSFEDSNLAKASTIVVLCKDENDIHSDSVTMDLVSRAREANPTAEIVCEIQNKENRQRMIAAGANTTVRPIRTFPEMMSRAILSPGAERFAEDLFDAQGEECVRYNFSLTGRWAEIATNLIVNDIGMPLAYIDTNGTPVANARPDCIVEAAGFLVLVREDNLRSSAAVEKIMKSRVQQPVSNAGVPQPL
jgi:voltage-gated potassium channel